MHIETFGIAMIDLPNFKKMVKFTLEKSWNLTMDAVERRLNSGPDNPCPWVAGCEALIRIIAYNMLV